MSPHGFAILAATALLLAASPHAQAQVRFTSNTRIAASNKQFEGMAIIVDGAVVTIDGRHEFGSLSIVNGGQVTHTAESERGMHLVIATDLSIASGCAIHADAKGYAWDRGTGAGWGGGTASMGGGHGGSGGGPAVSFGGGLPYGDPEAPFTLGSGSGHHYPGRGSAGGGAIRLQVGNRLTIEGRLSAAGEIGGVAGSGGNAGGAGGSVWVEASLITGSGAVDADGGDYKYSRGEPAGGGGGGRISLTCAAWSFSGTVSAFGGIGYGEYTGAAGTVYRRVLSTGTAHLTIDNNGRSGSAMTEVRPHTVTNGDVVIRGRARVSYPLATWGLYWTITGSLTIEAGASLESVGRGFTQREAPDVPGSVGRKPSISIGGGGGAHGGGGGSIGTEFGGGAYDSEHLPRFPGGGGGVSQTYGDFAGRGGGLLALFVGKDLVVDGRIDVSGNHGGSHFGAGAGGAILVAARRLLGTGVLLANGGSLDDHRYNGGSGGGGRIAVYCPDTAGFSGSIAARAGTHGNLGKLGQDGTWRLTSAPLPRIDLPTYSPRGAESFDMLPIGSGPDHPYWDPFDPTLGNAGAWSYPPMYAGGLEYRDANNKIVALRYREPRADFLSIVDTSSFDSSKSGHSLRVRLAGPGTSMAACVLEKPVYRRAAAVTRVEFDAFVPTQGVRGGFVGLGGGLVGRGAQWASQHGAGFWATQDCGPLLYWESDGSVRALYLDNSGWVTRNVGGFAAGAWHRVRVDYHTDRETYDVWLAPAGKPLVRTAAGVPTVFEPPLVDRYIVGTWSSSGVDAYYDSFSIQQLGSAVFTPFGTGVAGKGGVPELAGKIVDDKTVLTVGNPAGAPTVALLLIGADAVNLPFLSGTIYTLPVVTLPVAMPAAGLELPLAVDGLQAYGSTAYVQVLVVDGAAPGGLAMSKGLEIHWGG